ncbi:hypothetical protein [Streptomyces sp. NPDC054975]
MSHEDHRAVGASPAGGAGGRRRRHAPPRSRAGARWLLAGGGVVGLGLLVAALAGAFRAGETVGTPTGDDGRPGPPSLIQADPPGGGEAGGEEEGTGASSSGASPGPGATTAPADPSATPSATRSGTTTTTASPSATADALEGDSPDRMEKPGKSGSAPGASKRPR